MESKIMKVKEIPSDKLVVMTPELYQEFCQGGCVPACHLTHRFINIGDKFKLSTVDTFSSSGNILYGSVKSIQVMLAEKSSLDEYKEYHKERIKDREALMAKDRADGRTGCFIVDGKIIH
jgi:hypothetical protein